VQALWTLGMARPSKVLEVGSMGGEQDGHERDAIGRAAAAKFPAVNQELPSRR